MNNTEKKICFAESLPDFNYKDDIYQYFEEEFIKRGNLSEVIEAINLALVLGCIDDLNKTIMLYKGGK